MDWEGLPRGSSLIVLKEKKKKYKCLWCSPFGSYNISVPKFICEKVK